MCNTSILHCLQGNYVLFIIYFQSLEYISIVLCPCIGCDECSLSLLYVQNVLSTWQAASRPAVCRESAKRSFRNESVRATPRLSAVRDCSERLSLANNVYQAHVSFHPHSFVNRRIWFYVSAFLGAFAKLRIATISFVISACPSVCMELCSHWMDFHQILHMSICSKFCRENASSINTWQE